MATLTTTIDSGECVPLQLSASPAAWYSVCQPDRAELLADGSGVHIVWTDPEPLAVLDSSTLADLIRAAADELARRGYWNRER